MRFQMKSCARKYPFCKKDNAELPHHNVQQPRAACDNGKSVLKLEQSVISSLDHAATITTVAVERKLLRLSAGDLLSC